MKKITILHYSLGGTGGLSKLSTKIANYWNEQGHQVTRIGIDKPYVNSPYVIEKGVKQMQIRKGQEVNTNKMSLSPIFLIRLFLIIFPLNLFKKRKLNKFLQQQDVVIIQNPLILKWLNKKNKNKTTLYMHQQYGGGSLMKKIISFQKWTIKRKISKVICLDVKSKEILNKEVRGVEFEFIPNFLTEEALPLNSERSNITFLGRISLNKNIDWIVDAAKNIQEDIHMYGNISPDFEKKWSEMDKPSNLKYMGRTNEAMKVLSESKIGLHTGKIEGYSLSMVESACAGNILVSADSWDSYDPNLKNIIHIASTKEEFIEALKKAIKQKTPPKKEVIQLREYFSFENYIKKVEAYLKIKE